VPACHNSRTCNYHYPGHQEGAKKQNTMGGSTRQHHKTILPSAPTHPAYARQQQQQQQTNTYQPAPPTMPYGVVLQYPPQQQQQQMNMAMMCQPTMNHQMQQPVPPMQGTAMCQGMQQPMQNAMGNFNFNQQPNGNQMGHFQPFF
jgi:hypothetical protein